MSSRHTLAFDPSLDCTGFAVVADDGSPDGRLVDKGFFRTPEDGTAWERILDILRDVGQVYADHAGELERILVETPQTFTKGKLGKRSPASLPNYGMVVGAVLTECRGLIIKHGRGVPLHPVSASEWAMSAPQSKDDRHKQSRVRWCEIIYRLPKGALGAKSNAGNVADAILLARWGMERFRAKPMSAGGSR